MVMVEGNEGLSFFNLATPGVECEQKTLKLSSNIVFVSRHEYISII